MILRIIKRFLVTIPKNKLTFKYSKSSGPGGQNVNKTNSKVKLCVDLSGEWIESDLKNTLKLKNPSKVNSDTSQLIIQSDTHRSQLQNHRSCLEKLEIILEEAERVCLPPREPSLEQKRRVEGFKEKFDGERREEKIKRNDKKTSRSLKNNWKH